MEERFLKDTWTNEVSERVEGGVYIVNWLRRISRETKTQYVSETRRAIKDYDSEETEYVFIPDFAKRYKKLPNGGVGYRGSANANEDGYATIDWVVPSEMGVCKLKEEDVLIGYGTQDGLWEDGDDKSISDYLKELFKVDTVQSFYYHERGMNFRESGYTPFHHEGTNFHITHTCANGKYMDVTIMFWLFEGKVVYCRVSGINHW